MSHGLRRKSVGDYAKAREWYEKAAAKDNANAMYYLGRLYENGWGVAQDYAKAREWYQKAADKGDTNAKARLKQLPTTSQTTPPVTGTDADAGKQIFQEKCTACHTIGNGPLVGPDLKGVTARRPREWLRQFIAAPDVMLAKKDPVATSLLHQFHDVPTPNLGLGDSDVTAVLAYLDSARLSGQRK